MRHSKLIPEVNAGSMADIAFLLLIFFLVTATISSDDGINRILPSECPIGIDCYADVNERNILRIMINNNDEIMIEKDLVALENLKSLTLNFLDNNGDNSCNYCSGLKSGLLSDNPTKAIVSLQNNKQTTYKTFIAVQNELAKAYFELRQNYSLSKFNKPFDKLSKEELKHVKAAYPFKLLEVETK